MMNFGESVICVAIIPGAVAGLVLGYTSSNYNLPWWGMIIVGLGGWFAGFGLAAVGGTIFERFTRRRRVCYQTNDRTKRSTGAADIAGFEIKVYGGGPVTAVVYPIEMQSDELLDAIASFRSAQELGLAYAHNRLRLPVPCYNRDWMQYGYTVPPEAAVVAEADGVKIDVHGAGIEVVHPDFTIDYDYGPNGECDCFDAWRLALHRHRCRGLPWPVEGQLDLQALLDSAAAVGTVIPLSGSPYFVHPDFRSNWTPSQTDG